MKFIDVIRAAIGNSFRSKMRTTLTVIAIFIGAFTLTITTAIGTGVSSYIDNQLASIGAADIIIVSKNSEDQSAGDEGPAKYDPDTPNASNAVPGAASAGFPTEFISDSDIEGVRLMDGILDVNPVVMVNPSYIAAAGSDKFALPVDPNGTVTRADLAAGSQLGETGEAYEMLLPSSYVTALGFDDAESAVGQTATIGIADYSGEIHELSAIIAGVQNESLFGTGAGVGQPLIDALAEVQNLGKPDQILTGYFAAVAHIDINATQAEIDAIKADLDARGYHGQTVADQIGTIQTVIGGIIGVLNAFAVIALIAASFGIINTLLMSVQERTREIGLMKAMGMSGGRIFALFSAEAVFIGFLGSAIGALVAVGVGSLISRGLADTVLADLEGLQVLQFAPASVGSIMLAVMLIAFLAGTLPARRASRQNPIDALRYE